MEDRQKTSLIMLFFFCGPLTERVPEVFVQLDCPLFQASFGEVSCHHHPFNVHTLYGVPAAPAPDHHPQPPFHRLTATTRPQEHLTCVVPWKACSTSAALIWRTLVEYIGHSFRSRYAPFSRSPQWEAWEQLSRIQ
jgi:hypothetical protein